MIAIPEKNPGILGFYSEIPKLHPGQSKLAVNIF
jgi:hypothetical protein